MDAELLILIPLSMLFTRPVPLLYTHAQKNNYAWGAILPNVQLLFCACACNNGHGREGLGSVARFEIPSLLY